MNKPNLIIVGMPGVARDRMCRMLGAEQVASAEAAKEHGVACLQNADAGLHDLMRVQSVTRVIGFYNAPWDINFDMTGDGRAQALTGWMDCHKRMLRLLQTYKGRVLMINAADVDNASPFLEKVREFSGRELDPEARDSDAMLQVGNRDPLEAIRAKMFEWLAPEAWDVYEMLESCAWLNGREPEYRSSMPSVDPALIEDVLAEWQSARKLPLALAELSATASRADAAEAALEIQERAAKETESQLRSNIDELEKRAKSNESESQLLLTQLHQVQEELEKVFLESQSVTKKHDELRRAACKEKAELQGQLDQQQHKAADVEAQLRKQFAELERRVKSSDDESQLLLLQLHQVQEELERYFLENREMATLMENSKKTFRRARELMARMSSDQAVEHT